jgi:hypothetical protein
MASLSDIFNPSLLIFLGILVLVAALLVVYFETKHREQNHKINSMFSLVSSLADEVNNLKFSLAHINSMPPSGGSFYENYENKPLADETNPSYFFQTQTQHQSQKPNLISVSDDSDSDSSDESELNEDDLQSVETTDNNELDLNDDNLSENNNNDIKVLKLNINDEKINNDDSLDEEEEDLDEIEDLDDESLSSQNSSSSFEKLLSLQNSIVNDDLEHSQDNLNNTEILDISSSDLKTININLEEPNTEIVDYKKLSLTKLRSIVVEKSLSQDTSKLKKNELLKLLGVE